MQSSATSHIDFMLATAGVSTLSLAVEIMSSAIAIKNPAGRHIGFLLSAPNNADPDTGVVHGYCIFRSLPRDAEDFHDPLAEELFSLQQQAEFEFRMIPCKAGQTYEVRAGVDDGYDIVIEADGDGELYRATGGLRETIGKAQLAKPKTANKPQHPSA